jgi:signal transduction histidine kinase
MTLLVTAAEPTPIEAQVHAIKNCASVILGLASTLESHVDTVGRLRVTQLMDSSRRLRELLTQTAHACDCVREDVCITELLRRVVERLAPQAESCGVHLAVDCAGGTVLGDFGALAETLYNVASNALHASHQGGTVRMTTRRTSEGDHEWSVADEGCGIPASVMSRLGTVGVTTRQEGTGLGLSLALQVISRHDGLMSIESVEGKGTTVLIWLPAGPTSKPGRLVRLAA